MEGGPGNFTATVRQNPRYVDLSKCTSCGECAKVCPVTLSNEYDENLSVTKAVYKKYAQAIPGAYAIRKTDKAPCSLACPAGLNVQGYVQMAGQGKYKEALQIIMEELPLPGVLGRICPHGCEDACRRCEVDQPVAIRNLKRLAADKFDPRNIEIKTLPKRQEKVAIIGSGPAGLSAAYHLARKGVLSTIFEALPKAGGMLRVGIPEHRLPRDVLDREIEVITNLGVEIKTNTPLGPDLKIDDLFRQGYKSVYIAIGAHKGFEIGVPGEKAAGVRQGVDFLREVNLTGKADVGKKVAIIGGGNVAIDVARCAVRLGAAKVSIIYRRTRGEMPAWEEEIHAAEIEGTEITYLSAPQEILTADGKVVGLRCIRMELGEPDSSGRRRPVPVPGSEYDIETDQIIPAIGQRPDLTVMENVTGIGFTRWGTVETDSVTYSTGREGVFAGGDVQTGPWVAIGAIAAGREAAESILRYLDGKDMAEGREPVTNENPLYRPIPDDEVKRARAVMTELPAKEREGNFKEVELGFTDEEGKAEAGRCLNCGYCCECFQCVDACLAGAVDHSQKVVEKQVEVGSVILCPGTEIFDPSILDEFYHYKTNPNILTSLEFERILSASGPTMGHLVRPSDKKEPEKIAWLQCIGSRDNNRCGNGYCSSVCCMYAVKEAMIAKEHAHGDLDCAIFNMDMRTFGKDYEKYYNRAKDKDGVRFIKARVHTMEEIKESGNLLIRFADESGEIRKEEFDMVVLSVGLKVPQSTVDMAKRLGIDLDKYSFAASRPFTPIETSRQGVYACGIFQGPKDIPSSVIEASAAACAAGGILNEARGTLTKTVKVPDEIDVAGQEPRIGVFVCNCGINIAGVVNVKGICEYASGLPYVVFTGDNLFTCSQDSQDRIKDIIIEKNLNRVVVAACTPKTHEGIFMDTLEACGLNKYLFEMANIRNQDSWTHSSDPLGATEKAKDLVKMAVARAATLNPLHEKKIPVNKRALVIGGGVAGMNAALGLADQGFETVLVEKEPQLGGMATRLTETIEGEKIGPYLSGLIKKVSGHSKIQVLTQSLIVGFSGFKGNFTTEIIVGPGMYERKIDHGVVILATGANEYTPSEYLYGQDSRVMTQVELAQKLGKGGASGLESVVMIQCIGSRNEENPNCSRVCCQSAIKNAIHIKELNPDANIYILYRDIRMYGLLEDYYTEARRKGIFFFRYTTDDMPVAESNDYGLMVTFRDHVLGRRLKVTADSLILSAGMRPTDTTELSSIVKLALNAEGYFMEAHVKLRPVDMATEGIFVCGTAHSPKLMTEAIPQALAAVSRATTFLSQDYLTLSAVTARVEAEKCASCLICVRSCPYGVPRINEDGVSEIDIALCHGCGVCAAECPAKAIELDWYEDDQILSKVEALLEGVI
ncbi:MAG: FAD-binding protein [Desulfobacteraceae bacterium]|nr:MAG: FAD-binding protein [Desulfobacteraceae bacterium]